MAGLAFHPGPSFRDVVAGSSSSAPGQVSYELGSFLGSPALFISDEDMVSLAKPFLYTLVGRFSASRPHLDAIRIFVNRLKFSGEVKVFVHDSMHVLFRFSVASDYKRFFLRRVFTVFGVNMDVLKWSPFFDFGNEIPIVPLWIRFPGLRLQLCDQTSLMFLGKSFGEPLSVDSLAAGCGKSPVARVLVEVDVSKPLPDRVWIGSRESGAFQAVVFENVPQYCCRCSSFGHLGSHCPLGQALVIHSGVVDGSVLPGNPPPSGMQPSPVLRPVDGSVGPQVLGGAVTLEGGQADSQVFVILPNGEISTGLDASLPPPLSPSPLSHPVVDGSEVNLVNAPVDVVDGVVPPRVPVSPGVPASPRVEGLVVGGVEPPIQEGGCRTPQVVPSDPAVGLVDKQVGTAGALGAPHSGVFEELPLSGDGIINSFCPGFPSMGITTRSKSRAFVDPSSARGGGGNSGGKSGKKKKNKRKNKIDHDHAMAVALNALFKPPDYNV